MPLTERFPAVQGRFYPGDPAALHQALNRYLTLPDSKITKAHGVVLPHAGWDFSGHVVGRTLAQVDVPARAIVICPNHTGRGSPLSLSPAARWNYHGFEVEADEELTRQLLASGRLELDADAHHREHAIEVLLPFLWQKRHDIRIAAICLGAQSLKGCLALGEALAEIVSNFRDRGEDTLLVASSDMSHYIPEAEAEEQDHRAISAMLSVDASMLYRVVHEHRISMCGVMPATVVIEASRLLGATAGQLAMYTNSGKVTGDRAQVVGYAGIILS